MILMSDNPDRVKFKDIIVSIDEYSGLVCHGIIIEYRRKFRRRWSLGGIMKRVFDLKKINLKKKNELLPLNKNFDYIKAYHGCKIYKENQFENGLNLLTKEYLIEKILDFKSKLGIDIDLKKYDFRDDLNTTEGKIWFCLAKEELLRDCNHYIIYGSEVLHGILKS